MFARVLRLNSGDSCSVRVVSFGVGIGVAADVKMFVRLLHLNSGDSVRVVGVGVSIRVGVGVAGSDQG
jgi:hypothetical protein